MDALDDQLVRYRAMEKDAKSLAQDHVLTAELIERLIERIEIDHERNIRVCSGSKMNFRERRWNHAQKYVIALYIRLSVEDFKTESLSIPNQKLILRGKGHVAAGMG